MNEEKDPANLIRILFPLVFGEGSKDNAKASLIFQKMVGHASNLAECFIEQKEGVKDFALMLTKSSLKTTNPKKSLVIKFLCEHGCAIKMTKEQAFSIINVQVITLSKWGTGAHDSTVQNLDFVNPQGQSSIFAPTTSKSDISLQTFFTLFQIKFPESLNRICERQKEASPSPGTVEEAIKLALNFCKKHIKGEEIDAEAYVNSSKKKNQHFSKNISLQESNVAVAWYLAKAVAANLLGTHKNLRKRFDKFIISFLCSILKEATKQRPVTRREKRRKVNQYKLCLDEIISQYKQRVSKSYGQNHLKFNEKIRDIEDNLIKMKGGRVTARIQDRIYPEIHLPVSELPAMPPHENILPTPATHKKEKINTIPIKVDKKFLFEELLKEKNLSKTQSQINNWILLTEETIWNLAGQLANTKDVIDLDIHMRQIQCEIGVPKMEELNRAYEATLLQNPHYYGMGLEGQAISHIQLVRAISAVAAFQSVKLNRQNKMANLSAYSVPFDIDDLFSKFQSNSKQAREALRRLKVYNASRKNRRKIFELNDSNNFNQFASLAGRQSRNAFIWIQMMNRMLQRQRQLEAFKVKSKFLERKLSAITLIVQQTQTLHTQQSSPQVVSYASIQNIYNQIHANLAQAIQSPCQAYNNSDPYQFAFANNIPSDILGMAKMLFLAQNPTNEQIFQQQQNNAIFQANLPEAQKLNLYAKKTPKTQTLYSNTIVQKQSIQITYPQNRIYLYSKNTNRCDGYSIVDFSKQTNLLSQIDKNKAKLIKKCLQYPPKFQNNPEEYMRREHSVYGNLIHKPESIELQCFTTLCNVRSAEHTQLLLLCSGILERKIISDSYEKGLPFAQMLILVTGSRLDAYKSKTEQIFGKIQKLISKFPEIWNFSDPRFCPVLAPLLSIFSQEIRNDNLVDENNKEVKDIHYILSKKCWDEFKRLQSQKSTKPGVNTRRYQRFICMAAICCFREVRLDEGQEEQILFLLKLIFQLRTCQILVTTQNQQANTAHLRPFEKQLEFQVQKAIYCNIEVISNYLAENLEELNNITSNFDHSFSNNVVWAQAQNPFVFNGDSQGTNVFYQLDIFKGCIYKNGKEFACLDERIKANPYFKLIFGEQKDFQVFPSGFNHQIRIKEHFTQQFKIDQKKCGKVYLEFSQDGKEIRHIIKKPGEEVDEEIWTLVPREKLKKSSCYFPKIYLENYLGWYSKKRNCIVFRKPDFKDIYEIGMVVFLQELSRHDYTSEPKIIKASHITYHGSFENQNLDQICDPQNIKYDDLILRKKDTNFQEITPYKMLSKFEPVEYIIQLKSRVTHEAYFWLHRYQIKFKANKTRLLSETYYEYALMDNSDQHSLFTQFPCLVLQKYQEKQTVLSNSNRRILIVSEGKIGKQGQITKDVDASLQLKSYKYEIHDYFGDIRGSDRLSILHLAAIMLSINDNIVIQSLEMTPLQYAMYLMNSCFTNRPLLTIEAQKLNKIIEFGSTEVILLAEAIWRTANYLSKPLPFADIQETNHLFLDHQKTFSRCRTLYSLNYDNNSIKFRQKINPNILHFLAGFNQHQNNLSQIQSDVIQECSYEKEFWHDYNQFTGQSLAVSFTQISQSFTQFRQKEQQLNIWDQKSATECKIKVPQILQQLKEKHRDDIMMQEMIDDKKKSSLAYQQEEHRIKQIIGKFTQQERAQQRQLITELHQNATDILTKIQKLFDEIKFKYDIHPDVVSGIRPKLSPTVFTSILCDKYLIMKYFPNLRDLQPLKLTIKIWMELKIRVSSLKRTYHLLEQRQLDIVAIMREVQSPREEVFQNNIWLCFEAEMKVQLWRSQIQTYKHLLGKKRGSFCQLNMGEGKTQVIIPLMILNAIYNEINQEKYLPRINLLSSLFEQARGNFFKYLSVTGFKIPSFQIPFDRKVMLTKDKINSVKQLIHCFSNKVYILMTRQSRLSETLRFHQGKIIHKNKNKDKDNEYLKKCKQRDQKFEYDFDIEDCNTSLIQGNIFDIFDEIDALMSCKKSYIYSIGNQKSIDDAVLRFEVSSLCIQMFLSRMLIECLVQRMAVTDETIQDAVKMINKGEYPKGLRLTLDKRRQRNQLQKRNLRRTIAKAVISSRLPYYSFVGAFNEEQMESLVNYLTQPQNSGNILQNLSINSKKAIYILRGLLAYGLLQHCLSMRCGVDFGVPDRSHKKKIAVPYEAAQCPSKTNEYQQTEVSILLSLISYYVKGITQKSFQDCLSTLSQLPEEAKIEQYQRWKLLLDTQTRRNLKLKTAKEIDYQSAAHQEALFDIFKKNRKTIAFWLNNCVFPKDLKEYSHSICSSAWDLAYVKKSVGFSGTKDNRWLYPYFLHWSPSKSTEILATDGKMMHLIESQTKRILLIKQHQNDQAVSKSLWQRFVELALSNNAGCIIDAGAIFAGISLRQEIVPWIANHPLFNQQTSTAKFSGISFCDLDGKWFVYDLDGKEISRGTTIPDHKTFAIFDQARTRGADLKLDGNIIAAVSLGPDLTFDDFQQAVGRMRKLGRNQKLIIMATREIYSKFDSRNIQQIRENQNNLQLLPKIFEWCLENSINGNNNLMVPYAELGLTFVHSIEHKVAYERDLSKDLTLEKMYSNTLKNRTVAQLKEDILSRHQEVRNSSHSMTILAKLQTYGRTVRKHASNMYNVCERQVQKEVILQNAVQFHFTEMAPIAEIPSPSILTNIKHVAFKFDPQFKMTWNLINTTLPKQPNDKVQIPNLEFIKIKNNQIVGISIREASEFIKKNIIQTRDSKQEYNIFMLNDLESESTVITKNKVEGAFVSAKFMAGFEKYTEEEENILVKIMKSNIVDIKKKDEAEILNLALTFLKLKQIQAKKFKGSTLQNIVKRLCHES